MDEKILIVSKRSKFIKNIYGYLFALLLIVSLLTLLIALVVGGNQRTRIKNKLVYYNIGNYWDDLHEYKCVICEQNSIKPVDINHYSDEKSLWQHIKREHRDMIPTMFECALHLFIWHWIFLLLMGHCALKDYIVSRKIVVVTDKNVYMLTAFGAKIVLPIDKITAYTATKIFSIITIHAIRGTFCLWFVTNNWNIVKVLDKVTNRTKSDSLQIGNTEDNISIKE